MIRLLGVTKRYPNGLLALNDASLSIAEGEFAFLIGPTGAGKSTLLRLLYRADVPTRGKVSVAGRDITRLPARQVPALRRTMGIVFQDFKLLPRKTAYENVAFALRVTGAPPEEVRPRAMQALEVVGLADRVEALPWQLSGGEQQRASIARAIVHRPPPPAGGRTHGQPGPPDLLGDHPAVVPHQSPGHDGAGGDTQQTYRGRPAQAGDRTRRRDDCAG